MKYERIEKGYFLERPNRFTAEVEIQGKKEIVHVKNTGRCAELLVPGATVYVQRSDNPERKTKWDLICVKKGNRLINMDSQIPNKAVKEWIEAGNLCENPTMLRQEVTYGNSRFDLYAEEEERKIFYRSKRCDTRGRWSGKISGCANRAWSKTCGRTVQGGSGWI
mgnify:FL=1